MNISDLTIGQVKELSSLIGGATQAGDAAHSMIGKKVIVRTCSAGVWFGTLEQKDGNEVIVAEARRMWKWWAAESISLSAVAVHGVNHGKSKIVEPVPQVWLQAIEITPCSPVAIETLEGAPYVKAQ